MKKLLLPYAFDSAGNLVHIECARKGETYKCPECGEHLILNISKIPKGEKYHRRNHFSHPKGCPDNYCSESFLHKLFKKRAVECIQKKLDNNEKNFEFEWFCEECYNSHIGNMFKKATSVCMEYDLGICRPDIALLDKNRKVVIVIEIVFTHKPEPEVIKYYNDNKIGCLQINVTDFEDCECVEEKLTRPDKVNLCSVPSCKTCGNKMQKAVMNIINATCWRCNKEMKIAFIECKPYNLYLPNDFTEEDIKQANYNGANIKINYSLQTKESYFANTCKHCGAFIGKHYMHDYYNSSPEIELDLGYRCFHYIERDKRFNIITNWEKVHEEKINEKILKDGTKLCPFCGQKLRPIKGLYGYFYGCINYPNCKYTESLEDRKL